MQLKVEILFLKEIFFIVFVKWKMISLISKRCLVYRSQFQILNM
jgi:hypothetical protein